MTSSIDDRGCRRVPAFGRRDTDAVDLTRRTALGAGLIAVVVALTELALARLGDVEPGGATRILVALVLGASAGLSRLSPLYGAALLIVVELGANGAGVAVAADELAVAVVIFQCARYGGLTTLWVSGLLVPAAYLLSGAFLANAGTDAVQRIGDSGLTDKPAAIALLIVTIASPLAAPWLLGFGLRWRARAERDRHALAVAEAQSQAQEREAQLAREVHDVVGHSLVVILRQADSVRFLADDTPEVVLTAVDHIAASARSSLTEVRRVLSSGVSVPVSADLDELIGSIPALVATVDDRVLGTPRTLPSTTAAVALRVLQEMLTNALKHGDGDRVEVTRDWRDGLLLRVRNPAVDPVRSDGMGLAGMRERLQAIGGSLVVRREHDMFTVEATIPVSQAAS